jgi:23S rRNA U2552 (ribose-2'-O)-methylase RlmE/FtsJ
MSKITFVTALVDIKRSELSSKSFHRSFARYLDTLKALLNHLRDKNLVIYIDKENEQLVRSIKNNNIIIKYVNCDNLRQSEYYDKIQKIRNDNSWRNQVGWLSESTQANLELYNPLIFNKIHWLADVANENPFNTEYFVWIDAGIANAQCHPGYFSKPWLEDRLCPHLDKFLFLCFPYDGHDEIHGFKREGMHKFSNVKYVDRVARATFFGGRKTECLFFSDKFREIAHKTLEDGYMGTEESIYTILSYVYSDLCNVQMIQGNGLVFDFFERLQNNAVSAKNIDKTFNGNGTFIHCNARVQQHPKAFEVFEDFFNKNTDIELVIELGSGGGGLSMFLSDQCKKHNIKFVTYEKNPDKGITDNPEFSNRNIDFRKQDIFDEKTTTEVKDMIGSHGKAVVLCDGGNKINEFNTYVNYLKLGDIIMAHDYAPNDKIFNEKYRDKIWNWMEISDANISNVIRTHKLKDYHKEFEDIAWVCKTKSFKHKTDLYVVTFNSPAQFEFTVKKIKAASIDMFNNSDKYVLNNSTDESVDTEYKKLFNEYGFTEFKQDNIGICGGRQFIAEHFEKTQNEYMIFFEDDMGMNGPDDACKKCKNGFSKYHYNLYNDMISIMDQEGYDFLKWSFTEFFGDNTIQWSWYNVPQKIREEIWPNKTQLPKHGLDKNPPLCKFNNIKSYNGLPYADGEIYYCNWPQIVSKTGNRKMFLETKWEHPYEQTWMSYMYQKTIKAYIKPAILLLSPITHNRFDHYDGKSRKEH